MPDLEAFRKQAAPGVDTTEGPSTKEILEQFENRITTLEEDISNLLERFEDHTHSIYIEDMTGKTDD
jgi:hypothetical protein